MKFFFIRDVPLQLSDEQSKIINGVVYYEKSAEIQVTPNRFTNFTKEACEKLKELLETARDFELTSDGSKYIEGSSTTKQRNAACNQNSLRIMMRKDNDVTGSVTFRIEGGIFAALRKVFSNEIRVKLTLRNFAKCGRTYADIDKINKNNFYGHGTAVACPPYFCAHTHGSSKATLLNACDPNLGPFLSLTTGDMQIKESPVLFSDETFCEERVITRNVLCGYWMLDGNPLEGLFSVAISFDELPNFGNHFINKTILESGAHADLTILAGNGARIKCHKAFLLAHGIPAFQAMLGEDSSYQEATSGTIKMDDMSEEGVRAFVAYLYYGSIKEASVDCWVAFEVLYAAQKYGVMSLKREMTNVLVHNKNHSWCSVEVALQVFRFSRGMEDGNENDLMKGAITIMKRNFGTLKKSDLFKSLDKTEKEAIIELVKSVRA